LRVFAGSAPPGTDRPSAWARAVDHYRRVCEEAAAQGLPIGLQNHNHGGLCGTGADVVRFAREVNHPNLTVVLDCGQFVGSPGASGVSAGAAGQTELLASIRQTVPLARHVRVKFYRPRADGSEPGIPYDQVFDILRGVHYPGFLDIVYEPARPGGESARTAIPRIVGFLRRRLGLDANRGS
jgi:sugar phosphate isomerase/epimerase